VAKQLTAKTTTIEKKQQIKETKWEPIYEDENRKGHLGGAKNPSLGEQGEEIGEQGEGRHDRRGEQTHDNGSKCEGPIDKRVLGDANNENHVMEKTRVW
jgi:hypothetical protein